MTPETWEKIGEIFSAAAELDPAERRAFLDEACGPDQVIREEVESLLAANSLAGNFISEPAIKVADLSGILPEPQTLSGSDLGHYRIEKSIGKGGMGEVYLATDTRLNRRVAIKKLPDIYASDPNFVKRFLNEAQAAATLNHPNAATIYSVEHYDGRPFIAMEYVEGKTLDSMTPDEAIDLADFFEWFVPIADAIRHAHEKGVVHRDIKPGNIMISADGTPKILDFGLAQVATGTLTRDSTITKPGQIIGTPAYMSPEQAEGKDVDARSDIFSFGVVMYEALTGVKPFTGDSFAEVVSKVLKHDPPPVRRLRREIPADLSRLVTGCMKKDQQERIRDMSEVRAVLEKERFARTLGTSTGSFINRLYRESPPQSLKWVFGAGALVLLIAFAGWFYFSGTNPQPPINFANMTIRRLSQSQNVVFAQITPDGKSVAFNTIEDDESRALWIRRIEDRNALQLVPPQPVQYWGGLTVTDDGGYVYYATAQRAAKHATLYRTSALGGPPVKLVDGVNDLGSLSPDGKRILFVRYGDDRTLMYSASAVDGSDERMIKDDVAAVKFRDPHYSTDGKAIYYIRRDPTVGAEVWSLVRIPAEGGEETEIIPPQKPRISEIAVLQSGGLLINAVDPVSNLPQLFHVSLPDGKRTRITNDVNSYFGISVDRAASAIVSAQRYDSKHIWVGETADLASLRPVTAEPTVHVRVEWTPDGRLVYDMVENDRPHIWSSDADGKNARQLTPGDSQDMQPRISPDGRYIVFVSNRTGENKIWRMNIDGSGQTLLSDFEGAGLDPRFSPDGQSIFFNWYRNDDVIVGQVPTNGGTVSVVPPFSDLYWAISPDGGTLAYSFWDQGSARTKVGLRPIDRAVPTAILDISPTMFLKWTNDGKSLLYRDRQAGELPHAVVMKWDIGESAPKQYLSVQPESVLDISFSRDGSKVAVVRGKLITDAVILSKVDSEK